MTLDDWLSHIVKGHFSELLVSNIYWLTSLSTDWPSLDFLDGKFYLYIGITSL